MRIRSHLERRELEMGYQKMGPRTGFLDMSLMEGGFYDENRDYSIM